VFLPSRDLIAGFIEHSASASIIERRCDKVLTIFTPAFLASTKNKLYTDLAQYVGLQKQRAFIIPVMLKRCDDLPASLSMISKLSYDPSRQMVNFYAKMFRTFGIADPPEELLKYPLQFYQQPVSPASVKEPALDSTALTTSDFADLNTMSTTISELETLSSTLSHRLPAVPTHEPGAQAAAATSTTRDQHGKKSKASKGGILKALTKPLRKGNAYLAE